MDRNSLGTEHTFSVRARKDVRVDGVKSLVGFDESAVIFDTDGGELTVEGSALCVKSLDLERGASEISGEISGVYYSDGYVRKKRKISFARSE